VVVEASHHIGAAVALFLREEVRIFHHLEEEEDHPALKEDLEEGALMSLRTPFVVIAMVGQKEGLHKNPALEEGHEDLHKNLELESEQEGRREGRRRDLHKNLELESEQEGRREGRRRDLHKNLELESEQEGHPHKNLVLEEDHLLFADLVSLHLEEEVLVEVHHQEKGQAALHTLPYHQAVGALVAQVVVGQMAGRVGGVAQEGREEAHRVVGKAPCDLVVGGRVAVDHHAWVAVDHHAWAAVDHHAWAALEGEAPPSPSQDLDLEAHVVPYQVDQLAHLHWVDSQTA